jgi:hypothetical protein
VLLDEWFRESDRHALSQFGVGRSTPSMTSTSTGPRSDSSFNPAFPEVAVSVSETGS